MHRNIHTLLASLTLLALPLAGCDLWFLQPQPDLADARPAAGASARFERAPEQEGQLPPGYPYEEALPPVLDGMALMQFDAGSALIEMADEIEQEEEARDGEPVPGGYSSFLVGAASLLVMEAGALVVLGPPTLVLQDTFWNGTPSQVAWNAWEWTRTTVVGATTYTATLHATLTWGGYLLEMVVDAQGPEISVQDWTWYDGLVSWDGNAGFWTMYDLGGQQIALYTYLLDTSAGDLAILAVGIGTLTAFSQGDLRSLDFVDGNGAHLTVSWDAVTAEGSVVHPAYNEGALACWDTALQNVACM